MNGSAHKLTAWFLRLSLSAGFLSAVADRFGWWPSEASTWGSWDSFLAYTQSINPFLPASLIPVAGLVVTFLEVVLGIGLLINYKTAFMANCSGFLLLLFALAMTISKSIKAPLDYSVFSASAAAFSLRFIVSDAKQQIS